MFVARSFNCPEKTSGPLLLRHIAGLYKGGQLAPRRSRRNMRGEKIRVIVAQRLSLLFLSIL
jgi:hypothetical protein